MNRKKFKPHFSQIISKEAHPFRENGYDVLPVFAFLGAFLMKKMRMCFQKEKTVSEGFIEHFLAVNIPKGKKTERIM